jgi:hypothetical protein
MRAKRVLDDLPRTPRTDERTHVSPALSYRRTESSQLGEFALEERLKHAPVAWDGRDIEEPNCFAEVAFVDFPFNLIDEVSSRESVFGTHDTRKVMEEHSEFSLRQIAYLSPDRGCAVHSAHLPELLFVRLPIRSISALPADSIGDCCSSHELSRNLGPVRSQPRSRLPASGGGWGVPGPRGADPTHGESATARPRAGRLSRTLQLHRRPSKAVSPSESGSTPSKTERLAAAVPPRPPAAAAAAARTAAIRVSRCR